MLELNKNRSVPGTEAELGEGLVSVWGVSDVAVDGSVRGGVKDWPFLDIYR